MHEWVESKAYFLQVGALPIAGFAWIWLITRAFREGRAWGWSSLFFPPAGLAFAGRSPRRVVAPLILLALAILAATVPAIYVLCVQLDLGPRDKSVNGQRHVTLTGWDRMITQFCGLFQTYQCSRWPMQMSPTMFSKVYVA